MSKQFTLKNPAISRINLNIKYKCNFSQPVFQSKNSQLHLYLMFKLMRDMAGFLSVNCFDIYCYIIIIIY